jgi:TolA-binding protein
VSSNQQSSSREFDGADQRSSQARAVVFADAGPGPEALLEALDSVDCEDVRRVSVPMELQREIEEALGGDDLYPVLFFLAADSLRQHQTDALLLTFELTSAVAKIAPFLFLEPEDLPDLEMLQGQTGIDVFVVSSDASWDIVPQLLAKVAEHIVEGGLQVEAPAPPYAEPAMCAVREAPTPGAIAAREPKIRPVRATPTPDSLSASAALSQARTPSTTPVPGSRLDKNVRSQSSAGRRFRSRSQSDVPLTRSSEHDVDTRTAEVALHPSAFDPHSRETPKQQSARSASRSPSTPNLSTPSSSSRRMARRSGPSLRGGSSALSIPKTEADYFRRGEQFMQGRKFQEAHEVFAQGADLFPDDERFAPHALWAQYQVDASHGEAVQKELAILTGSSNTTTKMWASLMVGRLATAMGDSNNAVAAYKVVLNLAPDNAEASRELRLHRDRSKSPSSILERLKRKKLK